MSTKKKLEPKEIQVIESYVKIYNEIYDKIIRLESALNQVSKKKEALSKEIQKLNEDLTDIRRKESEFTESMIKKYGEFKIDLETFEIEPS
jgi:hypothetical protein